MKQTLLVWDFDGTLAYRDGMWTQSVVNILDANGFSGYDREKISLAMRPLYPWAKHELSHSEYFNGLSWWEYIHYKVVGEALAATGIRGDENRRLSCLFRDEYLKLGAWYLFDDAGRNLEKALSLGYDNVILSNHTPELSMLVEYLGITKYFKHIITSADIGYEKPNPKIFDAVGTLGEYERYIMIGDNYEADVLGALNCGFEAILVRKPNEDGYFSYSDGMDGIWEHILNTNNNKKLSKNNKNILT